MFDPQRFIAIDWSGAKTGYAKKIAIALCETGSDAPALVEVEGGWTREKVADFVIRQPSGTLTGFDFSFAPPLLDRGTYLPGEDVPSTGPAFWAHVDDVCIADPDLGAHSFIEQRYRHHFYLGKADGVKADYMRWRQCELAFNASGGGKAACVFDAIGAAQVSKASFAGMRLLHRVAPHVPIWPFQEMGDSAVVEIYCRAFIRHAGLSGRKVRDVDSLNAALAGLGSEAHQGDGALSDDQTDVLIAAAGLRWRAPHREAWHPAGLSDRVRSAEGWTFGVDGLA